MRTPRFRINGLIVAVAALAVVFVALRSAQPRYVGWAHTATVCAIALAVFRAICRRGPARTGSIGFAVALGLAFAVQQQTPDLDLTLATKQCVKTTYWPFARLVGIRDATTGKPLFHSEMYNVWLTDDAEGRLRDDAARRDLAAQVRPGFLLPAREVLAYPPRASVGINPVPDPASFAAFLDSGLVWVVGLLGVPAARWMVRAVRCLRGLGLRMTRARPACEHQ